MDDPCVRTTIPVPERVLAHMQCAIQEQPDGSPRMCGTCWGAATQDLDDDALQVLLLAYPPAQAAAAFYARGDGWTPTPSGYNTRPSANRTSPTP